MNRLISSQEFETLYLIVCCESLLILDLKFHLLFVYIIVMVVYIPCKFCLGYLYFLLPVPDSCYLTMLVSLFLSLEREIVT